MRAIKPTLLIILALTLTAGSGSISIAQDAEAAAPAEFTGSLKFVAKCTGTPEVEFGDGVILTRAGETYCRPSVHEMSDARFDGEWTIRENSDRYLGGPTLSTSAFHVTTDEGAWAQAPATWVTFGDGTAATQVGVFTGEGAYAAHVAVVEFAFEPGKEWTLRGVILGGELPPATQAGPAE